MPGMNKYSKNYGGRSGVKKKKKPNNEYIDLSLIDEVMELIIKRGIIK